MGQLITNFPLPIFSILSTLAFVFFFVGVLVWTFRLQSKSSMDDRAKLPFNDEPSSKSGASL